jgi:hypothetical protein
LLVFEGTYVRTLLHRRRDTTLGGPAVDAITAVRRYEQQNYGHLPPEELADTFRMAWSV